jgi:hypothetical protein
MEYEDFDPLGQESEKMVDWLIEVGILEEDGFDEDGELTYTYNFELMKVLVPDMYEEVMNGVNENLMNLFSLGFVKIDYDEQLQAHFSATEDGMEYFKSIHPDD